MADRTATARHIVRRALLTALAAATAAATVLPAGAGSTRIDPAALPRGGDPAVAHLVRDTIRDGHTRIPATTAGRHDALWEMADGYVVRDHGVGRRDLVRVTFITRRGERRVVARSRGWISVAVSPSGRSLAVQVPSTASGLQSVVTVIRPTEGRVVASRELRLATLAAVTDRRVLLGLRARWHDPATAWWSYRRDRLWRIADRAAVDADVTHDKVVLDTSSGGRFCYRVAALSRPARALWRSCRSRPRQWAPDGHHAIATHTYFDAAGTDRWLIVDGHTGNLGGRVTGRLAWDAVWEDDSHFLTLAQGDAGQAAVIRCDLSGKCERASRLWDVPVPPDPSVYYAPPPVILAEG